MYNNTKGFEEKQVILERIEKYLKSHPEIIEEAVNKYLENFISISDINGTCFTIKQNKEVIQ